jgi:uroporphyrinogen-III synthase
VPVLHGVGVLVTRPEQQATQLCALLAEAGATTTRLPAIEIMPTDDAALIGPRLASQHFDLFIYTSANAVRFGAEILRGRAPPDVAAIGPATARALEREGHRVWVPAAGYDSQSLLADPRLAAIEGRRVLLVKGCQGRELLQDELARRGAEVVLAQVYRRARARLEETALRALEARFEAGEIHVITATSAEIAHALIETATPAMRAAFDRVHWLVPGPRVAAALRERNLKGPLLEAASAEDHDLVAALVRWRRRGSVA